MVVMFGPGSFHLRISICFANHMYLSFLWPTGKNNLISPFMIDKKLKNRQPKKSGLCKYVLLMSHVLGELGPC